MSYFPDMFKPTGNLKAWLIHISGDDVVVYRLDQDGKPTGMATGPVQEAIGDPLTAAFPHLFVGKIGSEHRPSGCPWAWGFHWEWTWADVAAHLNGKSGSKKSHARGVRDALRQIGAPLWRYLDYDDDGVYALSSDAVAADEKQRAAAAAEGRAE